MAEKKLATSVPSECADVYYKNFNKLPEDLKKRISCHLLNNIFRIMVIPAINRARSVDRHKVRNRTPSTSLKAVIIIPADLARSTNKQALITDEMKKECISEFSWEEDAPYYDENGNLIEFTAKHIVPWDLCKDIYQMMVRVASHHKNT